MLYESKNNIISIAEELRVLNDYMNWKRRYNERPTIRFGSVDDDAAHRTAYFTVCGKRF
jgi:hypothetical protein